MRKKLNRVLIGLLLIFVFPLLVYADMGAPEIGDYDVVVTNKNGATIYDYSGKTIGTIPYDTKITINYEYYSGGILYGSVTYNNKNGEIKLEDVTAYSEDVDLDDYSKFDEARKLYVFRDDAYLYNGPSIVYGRVEGEVKIPVGEIITYKYYSQAWVYVEYKGTNGWLYNYSFSGLYDEIENSVAQVVEEKNKLYVVDDVDYLLVEPSDDAEKVAVDIPAGEELQYKYYYAQAKSGYVYVEYEDDAGWLYIMPSDFGADTVGAERQAECGTIFLTQETTVYEKANDFNSEQKDVIPAFSEVSILYSFVKDDYQWVRVYFDKEYYWIAHEINIDYDYDHLYNYGYVTKYKAKEDVDIYDRPSVDANKLGIIKKGDTVSSYYSYADDNYEYGDEYYSWEYVEYGDVKGWVLEKKFESEGTEEYCRTLIIEEDPIKDNDKKDDEDEDKRKELSPVLLVALAIGGAVVLALVILVVIKLVNRKK